MWASQQGCASSQGCPWGCPHCIRSSFSTAGFCMSRTCAGLGIWVYSLTTRWGPCCMMSHTWRPSLSARDFSLLPCSYTSSGLLPDLLPVLYAPPSLPILVPLSIIPGPPQLCREEKVDFLVSKVSSPQILPGQWQAGTWRPGPCWSQSWCGLGQGQGEGYRSC